MAPFEWIIIYNLGLIHLTMQQYPLSIRIIEAFQTRRSEKQGSIATCQLVNIVVPFHSMSLYYLLSSSVNDATKPQTICLPKVVLLSYYKKNMKEAH